MKKIDLPPNFANAADSPIHALLKDIPLPRMVPVDSTPDGLPTYVDAFAAEADGIVVVNRIKPHTSFRGKIESGLSKMIVIGVGKQKGAEICHNLGYTRMEQNLTAMCRATLAS